jgi:hypothetical protein
MIALPDVAPRLAAPAAVARLIQELRAVALRALARMYLPERGLFAFRLQRRGDVIGPEGVSRRYTAIVLIGLAGESPAAVAAALRGQPLERVAARLREELAAEVNLGTLALGVWGLHASGQPGHEDVCRLLAERWREAVALPTVELAWAVTALSLAGAPGAAELRDTAARRLMDAFSWDSGLFGHVSTGAGGLRSHVCCFADLVYPIYALSKYHAATGDERALAVAIRCAEATCALQGEAGQWWWHYDVRTGRVIERYPVYAVHQNSMAPMALLALAEVGPALVAPLWRGLEWLARSPELGGGSLIDRSADVIWRKVARREPARAARYLQALASRLEPRLRVPGLDVLLPPRAVDFETRPYHMAWILHAFPPRWEAGSAHAPA